jgi:hypothetical protein
MSSGSRRLEILVCCAFDKFPLLRNQALHVVHFYCWNGGYCIRFEINRNHNQLILIVLSVSLVSLFI